MILPASYANGFAPRDGQPLYPSLWRNCVFAAAPCLGPTGLTLRDWSGRNKHCTNMGVAAESFWTASNGRYAGLYDGVDDYSVAGVIDAGHVASQMAVSVWVKASGSPSQFDGIFGKTNGITWTQGFQIYWNSSTTIRAVFGSFNLHGATSGSVVATDWNHVVGIANGTNTEIWVNGTQVVGSVQGAFLTGAATNPLEIGRLGSNAFNFAGLIDDVRIYNYVVSSQQIRLLASRRGIAYEMAPRRRASVQVAAFNRRRRLLLGST